MAAVGERLLFLGASVRAAAHSALRAGFRVEAVDLFADADLAESCTTTVIERYPAGFLAAVEKNDCDGWIYTGGLENYARLVDEIARRAPLLGNRGDVLRRVRDPACLTAACARHGLLYPAWQASAEALPADGTWLRKGRRSSGGLQVSVYRQASNDRIPRHVYYQRRVPGIACAAVYVAAAGRAALFGVTRQLIGGEGLERESFRYAGSIGPLELDGAVNDTLQRLGTVLAEEFELQGLFGVDFMLDEGRVWLVEVNPRFPASVEILERTRGTSAVAAHVLACREGRLPDALVRDDTVRATVPMMAGKAIVYAKREAHISRTVTQTLLAANVDRARPVVADIPRANTMIEPHLPIATVFAAGRRMSEVEAALAERSEWLESIVDATSGKTPRT